MALSAMMMSMSTAKCMSIQLTCKVQVVDQDVDVDALSDDDVEHVVDAVLCCSISSLVGVVVVEVVVVDDLSLVDL